MKLAISGPGTCGKDTLAIWIGQNTSLTYRQSTSQYMAPMIYQDMVKAGYPYKSLEECYQDRVRHRVYWAEWIDRYNQHDPAAAYRLCLENQDILTGVRKFREIKACREANLYDLGIWVERPGVPTDPTMEYGPSEMDIVILNNRTVEVLHSRAERLVRALGVWNRKPSQDGLTQDYLTSNLVSG